MPADLNNPFGESCCDGGACSTEHESSRPCGCDYGANHLCADHKFKAAGFELIRQWRVRHDNTADLDARFWLNFCANELEELID